MPFVYHFSPKSMSATQYDEVIARLAAAGVGAPKGRLHHAAYGSPSALRVFDIWESSESFEEFGKTLVPILHDAGVDPGNPEVSEIHNIIVG
jgi:hypothetical protein